MSVTTKEERPTLKRGDKVRVRTEFRTRYPDLKGNGEVLMESSLGIAVKVKFGRRTRWMEIDRLEGIES